jgi:Zn-dependent peptidase ImmA (M78 family)/transcriptional regulator with XRE-family HTH domain
MVFRVKSANPKLLRWARQQAGLALEEVAAALGKDVSVIKAWERGTATPTYPQLERMAYSLYKRPLALFFFDAPPTEPALKQIFRSLPSAVLDDLLPDTRFAVRQALAMQHALAQLTAGKNPAEKRLFDEIKLRSNAHIPLAATRIREYLGIGIETQLSWKTVAQALEAWRAAIQAGGVFVFKRSFPQRDVAAFALHHKEFPVIYINNSAADTAKVFATLHALAYILQQMSGITQPEDGTSSILSAESRQGELFCRQFALEVLVPSDDLANRIPHNAKSQRAITQLANRYKVGRELVLRKFLDQGWVKPAFYEQRIKEWTREFLKKREELRRKRRGGNWYATQATYLGEAYLSLVFSNYYRGEYALEKLADYLNTRPKNIPGLERAFLKKTEKTAKA